MPSFANLEPIVENISDPQAPTPSTLQPAVPAPLTNEESPRVYWWRLTSAGLWAGLFFFLLEAIERNVTLSPNFLHFSERLTLASDGALTAFGFLLVAALAAWLPVVSHLLVRRFKPAKAWVEALLVWCAYIVPVSLFTLVWPRFLYGPFVNLLDGLADKGLPLTTRLSHHPLFTFTAAMVGSAAALALFHTFIRREGIRLTGRKAFIGGSVALVMAMAAYWLDGHYFVGHYEDTFHNPLCVLQLALGFSAMLCFLSIADVGNFMRRWSPALAVLVVVMALWAGFRFDGNQNVKALIWRRGVLVRQFVALGQKAVDWDGDGFSPILGGGDTDDRNPHINPLAAEIPGNGVNENNFGGDGQTTAPSVAPDLTALRLPETLAVGAPKRNVLFLSIDALRADHLGCYGYGRATSPNLDRFASQGLNFLHAYSQASNTGHSFSSIMTSSYGEAIFDPASPNLATLFRGQGYNAVFLSKRIMGNLLKNRRWSAYKSIIYRGMDADAQIKTGRKSSDAKNLTDKVIEFMKAHTKAGSTEPPFYAWVHFTDPHAKQERYVAHPEYNFGRRDMDLYDGDIAYTDYHLGRLFAYLESSGQLETTIIIITADHGEAFGEHGETFHGSRPYQEQSHVPLIVHAPGIAPRRVETPVASLDIAPTALGFAGIAPPPSFQGVNLLQLARMEHAPTRLIVSETPRNLTEPNFQAWGVTDTAHPEWRLIYDARGNTWELYNLPDDPQEQHNLIDERPTEAANLKQAFGEWMDLQSRHPRFHGWGVLEPTPDEDANQKPRRRRN